LLVEGILDTWRFSGSINRNFVGNFNAEYKVSDDGVSYQGIYKSNTSNLIYTNHQTHRVGVFYRREFNTIGELFKAINRDEKRYAESSSSA